MASWTIDDFSGVSDGSTIIGRAATVGGTWAYQSAYADTLEVLSGRVHDKTNAGFGYAILTNSATPTSASQRCSLGVHVFSMVGGFGAYLNSYYFCYYDLAAHSWNIYHTAFGGFPQATQVEPSPSFSAGNDYTVEWRCAQETAGSNSGMVFEARVGGTLAWTFYFRQSGLNVLTPGLAGFGFQGSTTGSTGPHVGTVDIGPASDTAATTYRMFGPAVVPAGIASQSGFTPRYHAGGAVSAWTSPVGSVLGSTLTIGLSDGAAGTFGAASIASGSWNTPFTYTPASAGAKTVTGTESTSNFSGGARTATLATTAAANVCVVDGNSISAIGDNDPALDLWVTQMQDALGPAWAVLSFALAGQTTVQMSSDAATQIDPLAAGIVGKKVLAALEIGNDIDANNPSPTGAVAYAHYQGYCMDRKAAGWDVLAISCPHRGAGFDQVDGVSNNVAFNAAVDAANALMRTSWTTYAGMFADLAADDRFRAGIGPITRDGTHFNSLGGTYISLAVGACLSAMATGAGVAGSGGGEIVRSGPRRRGR